MGLVFQIPSVQIRKNYTTALLSRLLQNLTTKMKKIRNSSQSFWQCRWIKSLDLCLDGVSRCNNQYGQTSPSKNAPLIESNPGTENRIPGNVINIDQTIRFVGTVPRKHCHWFLLQPWVGHMADRKWCALFPNATRLFSNVAALICAD